MENGRATPGCGTSTFHTALALCWAVGLACCGGCQCSQQPIEEPAETSEGDGKIKDDGAAIADAAHAGSQDNAARGRELYQRHCAACHGKQGDARGIAAAYLFPKPRDFQAGRFRLVSTKNNVPTREDLRGILIRGMPGSSMPPWAHLPQNDIDALVSEVIRLRGEGARQQIIHILREEEELSEDELAAADVQEEIEEFVAERITPGTAREVPAIAAPQPESIARGQAIYLKQGCHACHGKEGKGDGQKAMFDDEGFATSARDLSRGIYKGGHDPTSLYRRVAYGMPGTPMPSSQKLTPAQVIDLVHFLRSLSSEEQRQAAILNREKIVAASVAQIPENVSSDAWAAVKPVRLRMTTLWWRDDADPGLEVQAVHDGTTLAVRLSWEDETHDRHAAASDAFEDAVAVELFRGEAEPFIGMGDPKSPVDVWFWDADRQGAPLAVEDVYPRAVVDVFPFNEQVAESAEADRPAAKTASQAEISLTARAVGNPIVPTAGESGGSDLAVGGPGTVTFRLPRSQLVEGRGEWDDGRWNVVMTRSLNVDSPGDGVSLPPGTEASIAFAIWNGSQRDRDGKKLITIWQDLVIESDNTN